MPWTVRNSAGEALQVLEPHGHVEGDVTALVTDLGGKAPVYKFTYDFSVLGGATGAIVLTAANGALPNNFVVNEAWLDVITPLDSALHLATVACGTGQAVNDLVVAALVSGAPWSTTGPKVTIALLGTIATWLKMTAARSPSITVAIEALTAGKFNLFIEGSVSA